MDVGRRNWRAECTVKHSLRIHSARHPLGSPDGVWRVNISSRDKLDWSKGKCTSSYTLVMDSFSFVSQFWSRRYERKFSTSFWKYFSSMRTMGSHVLPPTVQKEHVSHPVATGNITIRLYSIRVKPASQVGKAQGEKESGIIYIWTEEPANPKTRPSSTVVVINDFTVLQFDLCITCSCGYCNWYRTW